MNERFSKFKKADLIKMWRTLKIESGYRMTIAARYAIRDNEGNAKSNWDCSLRELMDRHEERVIESVAEGG